MNDAAENFVKNTAENAAEMMGGFRQRLHARPELSEREHETARLIVARLSQGRPDRIIEGLGEMQTGVCAVYDSGVPGPVVLLRCELDALPIRERNDFAHRSVHDGISHKCGHDGHMATLVAVGDELSARPVPCGAVYLLFQPAEETGTGARSVIDDPAFHRLKVPDYVYAFHNVPKFPLGQVLLRRGTFAQGSIGFIADFGGVTSHSSHPEDGVNPSKAATALVGQVNDFGRLLAAKATAEVLGTVTYVEIGRAENGPNFGICPGQARVCGVLRARNNPDLAMLRDELAQRVAAEAGQGDEARRLSWDLGWHEEFAATESDDGCVAVVSTAAGKRGMSVTMLEQPFRWSEDFGYFTDRYKGAFFGLGSGLDQPQLHDDGYDYPDALIAPGAALYRAIIDEHLEAEERCGHGKD